MQMMNTHLFLSHILQNPIFISLYSPFDRSVLCVRGSGSGFRGSDLCDLDLDVPTQNRLCQDHPLSTSTITHVETPSRI